MMWLGWLFDEDNEGGGEGSEWRVRAKPPDPSKGGGERPWQFELDPPGLCLRRGRRPRKWAPKDQQEGYLVFFIAKRVKQYLKKSETPMSCRADVFHVLNSKFKDVLRDARRRARRNGRNTLKACDV